MVTESDRGMIHWLEKNQWADYFGALDVLFRPFGFPKRISYVHYIYIFIHIASIMGYTFQIYIFMMDNFWKTTGLRGAAAAWSFTPLYTVYMLYIYICMNR